MKMLSRALFEPESGAPRTRFNQPISAQRVFESVVFDFATIKRIRAAVPGATVNDAVLAIVGGAMRRYLKSKKELPRKSLMALAPVNTRQDAERATDDRQRDFVPDLSAGERHRRSAWAPRRRFRRATSQTKALSNAIGAHDLTDISKHAPPATLAFAGRLATMVGMGGMGPRCWHNCIVTNVPGANVELRRLARSYATGRAWRRSLTVRGDLRGLQLQRPDVHFAHQLSENGARSGVLRRLHSSVDRGNGSGGQGRQHQDVRRSA